MSAVSLHACCTELDYVSRPVEDSKHTGVPWRPWCDVFRALCHGSVFLRFARQCSDTDVRGQRLHRVSNREASIRLVAIPLEEVERFEGLSGETSVVRIDKKTRPVAVEREDKKAEKGREDSDTPPVAKTTDNAPTDKQPPFSDSFLRLSKCVGGSASATPKFIS